MAGIGFELKKLYSEKGILRGIRAFLYSFIVTAGPMMLCILLITFMQYLLEEMGENYLRREVFVAVIQYAFVFSLLISGGTAMYLSRFFADMMYIKRFDEILHGLDFALITSLTIGTIEVLIFLYFSSLDFITALLAYSLFMVLIVVWVYAIIITAIKNYVKIFRIYLSGVIVGIIITLVMVVLGIRNANYYLFAIVMTFTVIATRLMYYIRDVFKTGDTFSVKSIESLDLYGKLVLVGFFMNAGIYIQNVVYWMTDKATIVAKTFRLAPFYDVPMFYAFLTITPSMIFFVIFFETNFYDRYKEYYDQIIHGGGLKEMETAKNTMIRTLYQEYSAVMEIQLFFTIVFLILGRVLLPRIGISQASVDIFSIITLGCYIYAAVSVCIMCLLYFDDINGATAISFSFFMSVLVFTVISLRFGDRAIGFGFFIGSVVTFFIGYSRLSYYLKNLDYYTYCNQPLRQVKPSGIFTRLSKLVMVLGPKQ